MRKKIGFVLLFGLAVWFKTCSAVTDRDYRVKPATGDFSNLPSHSIFRFHVPAVVRFLGTDIYRPKGYFTQAHVRTPPEKNDIIEKKETKIQAMTTGKAAKLDSRLVTQLGLTVNFSFWETYGKWVLLGVVLCLLFVFFWK